MPFKLRLKKTRQYNVVSRNVLVLSVELVDKTTLECTLSSDSTGQDCLHNVCQRLGLQQSEFFGLRYMSKKPYPKVRWVELDRPLKKQLEKYAQSPNLLLSVMYYIHDLNVLQDDVTRSHYFLQVKQDVLEGRLRCSFEQAILLASYSLQAEFGDHQPDRHTAEYLKDFMLFPKQVVNEGDINKLHEAVVLQYSSLEGLAQDLAETYYILEAQRLDGYGQENFMARDERGIEVYLGASLLGIMVRPASGLTQSFYRWNDITNLFNHKRTFGIECQRLGETISFAFDEPDAAKYIWKMCVKQHTFYKKNQEPIEMGNTSDTRGLAIPDLQSSVMVAPQYMPSHYLHDMSSQMHPRALMNESCMQSTNENTNQQKQRNQYGGNLPQFDISFISQMNPQASDNPTSHLQSTALENTSHIGKDQSYSFLAAPSQHRPINSSFNMGPHRPHNQIVLTHSQPGMNQRPNDPGPVAQKPVTVPGPGPPQSGPEGVGPQQQVVLYSSNLSLPSTRNSIRRALLPQYRPAPDYDTALVQKYGPGVDPASVRATVLYSSQPEISSSAAIADNTPKAIQSYSQYKNYQDLSAYQESSVPHLSRTAGILMPGPLHNTYSTPDLARQGQEYDREDNHPVKTEKSSGDVDCHYLHGTKPPPPYPYCKSSSNSTPDLATSQDDSRLIPMNTMRGQGPPLTGSLGRLGSPDLSRTYENLSDLSEAIESLRAELTRPAGADNTFDSSYRADISRDDLHSIYQLKDCRVQTMGDVPDSGRKNSFKATFPNVHITSRASNQGQNLIHEPIYQNVGVLLSEDRASEKIGEESRARARSAPELDLDITNLHNGINEEELQRNRGNLHQIRYGEQVVTGGMNTVTQSPLHAYHHMNLQSQVQPQQMINLQQQMAIVSSTGAATGTTNTQNNSLMSQQVLKSHYQPQQNTLNWPHQLLLQQQQTQIAHQQYPMHHIQAQQILSPTKPKVDIGLKYLNQPSPPQQRKLPEAAPRKKWGAVKPMDLLDSSILEPEKLNTNTKPQHESQLPHNATHNILQVKHNVKNTPQPKSRNTQLPSSLPQNNPANLTHPLTAQPKPFKRSQDNLDKTTVSAKSLPTSPDLVEGSGCNSKDPRVFDLERILRSKEIEEEFASIPMCKNNPDFSTAMRPENINRNRYRDIVPYEENRTKITPSKDNKTGYVNCSQITATVGGNQRFYLCAQGPQANTVVHFWQCVWETDVHLIVMLNFVVGDTNTSKSFPYWPQCDNTSVECGQFRVKRLQSTVTGYNVVCRLQLTHVTQRKNRTLWHLQFTDWGEHGCPQDTYTFLSFLDELDTLRRLSQHDVQGIGRNKNTPVLVHCSAGVGRSGITILCDLLKEAADHNLPIEPKKVLAHLRQQRMRLVQTLAQYKFVYEALIAHLSKARLI